MRSGLAALVVSALAIVAPPRRADACHCLDDGPELTIPGNTLVPPNPTVYMFAPPGKYGLERGGEIRGARSSARIVATSPAFTVWRHDVETTAGTFELYTPYYSITYTIGSPPPNEARVVGVEVTREYSGCWAHVAIDLETTGNAVAYRFAWSDGTSTIVPNFTSAYAPTGGTSLGLVGCNGGLWNACNLGETRGVVMFALFSDGSEHKLGTSTASLNDARIRSPIELVNAAVVAPSPSPPRPPLVVVEVTAWWQHALAASLGVTAVALVAGLAALARRRRNHVVRITSR